MPASPRSPAFPFGACTRRLIFPKIGIAITTSVIPVSRRSRAVFTPPDIEARSLPCASSPASVLWAMYLVVAEKQGADWKKISGTIQNDILKEYIAQKEYIYPPAPSMRLVVDTFEFGSRFTPRFNTISISGYHIREAGSTALQELAFTLYDGVEYVEWARRRGLDVDEFGPR